MKTKRIRIERMYDASIEEMWEMWTTKEGVESWWGPDGFGVTVFEFDLRVGGTLHYSMNALGAEQIAFMKKENMPVSHAVRGRFTEVVVNERLAFIHIVDFVPNTAPFELETVVEIHPAPNGVKLVLEIEAMPDPIWTQRMKDGWEMELGKLEKALRTE